MYKKNSLFFLWVLSTQRNATQLFKYFIGNRSEGFRVTFTVTLSACFTQEMHQILTNSFTGHLDKPQIGDFEGVCPSLVMR